MLTLHELFVLNARPSSRSLAEYLCLRLLLQSLGSTGYLGCVISDTRDSAYISRRRLGIPEAIIIISGFCLSDVDHLLLKLILVCYLNPYNSSSFPCCLWHHLLGNLWL